jgi:hypothetical protein
LDALSVPAAAGDSRWAPLIDASQLSFDELLASDNSALALCVQRLVRGLDDPDGIISAFQNFAS